jgi:hypothetical protein
VFLGTSIPVWPTGESGLWPDNTRIETDILIYPGGALAIQHILPGGTMTLVELRVRELAATREDVPTALRRDGTP